MRSKSVDVVDAPINIVILIVSFVVIVALVSALAPQLMGAVSQLERQINQTSNPLLRNAGDIVRWIYGILILSLILLPLAMGIRSIKKP